MITDDMCSFVISFPIPADSLDQYRCTCACFDDICSRLPKTLAQLSHIILGLLSTPSSEVSTHIFKRGICTSTLRQEWFGFHLIERAKKLLSENSDYD